MQFQINPDHDQDAIEILDAIVAETKCSRTRAAIYAIKVYGHNYLGRGAPERPKERPPASNYSDSLQMITKVGP